MHMSACIEMYMCVQTQISPYAHWLNTCRHFVVGLVNNVILLKYFLKFKHWKQMQFASATESLHIGQRFEADLMTQACNFWTDLRGGGRRIAMSLKCEAMYFKKKGKAELVNKISLTLTPWSLNALYPNSTELLAVFTNKGPGHWETLPRWWCSHMPGD